MTFLLKFANLQKKTKKYLLSTLPGERKQTKGTKSGSFYKLDCEKVSIDCLKLKLSRKRYDSLNDHNVVNISSFFLLLLVYI